MKSEELSEHLRTLLTGQPVPEDAKAAQLHLAELLRADGFEVSLEVPVPHRGDGRAGRVDIEAERAGARVGIEIDRRRPRRKSVLKLRTRPWLRVIALRDPDPDFDVPVPPDLTVIPLAAQNG